MIIATNPPRITAVLFVIWQAKSTKKFISGPHCTNLKEINQYFLFSEYSILRKYNNSKFNCKPWYLVLPLEDLVRSFQLKI